jgi:hypothetical protein
MTAPNVDHTLTLVKTSLKTLFPAGALIVLTLISESVDAGYTALRKLGNGEESERMNVSGREGETCQ